MERREYQRIKTGNSKSMFYPYHDIGGFKEFPGFIDDISERGIGVLVKDEKYFVAIEELEIGEKLRFQAIDEYTLYNHGRVDIIHGEVEILRKESFFGAVKIGCKFTKYNTDLREYIKNRKVAVYLKEND